MTDSHHPDQAHLWRRTAEVVLLALFLLLVCLSLARAI